VFVRRLACARTQITFFAFHWTRGSPFWGDQGEHIEHTLWEQIDNGVPWTDTRKFLMVVPIVLLVPSPFPRLRVPLITTTLAASLVDGLVYCRFLVVSHYTGYAMQHLAVNALVLVVLMIGKLPEMHGVRILRINKGTVSDNE